MSRTKTPAATFKSARRSPAPGPGSSTPDLQTQFEALLDQVWHSEADWRLFDRIDAFCATQPDNCGVPRTSRRRAIAGD